MPQSLAINKSVKIDRAPSSLPYIEIPDGEIIYRIFNGKGSFINLENYKRTKRGILVDVIEEDLNTKDELKPYPGILYGKSKEKTIARSELEPFSVSFYDDEETCYTKLSRQLACWSALLSMSCYDGYLKLYVFGGTLRQLQDVASEALGLKDRCMLYALASATVLTESATERHTNNIYKFFKDCRKSIEIIEQA